MSKPRFRAIDGAWEPADDFETQMRVMHEHRELMESQSAGRRVAPEGVRNSGVHTRYVGSQRDADRRGFANIGEFAKLVVTASNPEPGPQALQAHERLRNAALTQYGSEGVGADGGYLVPPEFRAELLRKVTGETSLMSMCDVIPTGSNSVSFPKDETPPWGTGGIRAWWEGEAKTMPQSKPALETSTIRQHRVTCLVPVTDELLEDAPALSSYLGKKAPEVIDFKVTDAIVNGTGNDRPLGILNADHTITQDAEVSQVADTIHGLNLIRMWGRMPAAWRANAVWLIHPDAEPEVMAAGIQIGNPAKNSFTGGQLVYVPPGGFADTPHGALLGRPLIPSQACAELGQRGDIIFAAMNQYGIFLREPGLRADTSIHMWFDQGVTAFRFRLRIGGQPWWSSPLADKNGNGTRSAFVTLAAR